MLSRYDWSPHNQPGLDSEVMADTKTKENVKENETAIKKEEERNTIKENRLSSEELESGDDEESDEDDDVSRVGEIDTADWKYEGLKKKDCKREESDSDVSNTHMRRF